MRRNFKSNCNPFRFTCSYHSPLAISYRLYPLQTPHGSLLKHFPVRLINPYNVAQPAQRSAFFSMFYDHNFIIQTKANTPLFVLSSSFRQRTLGFVPMQVKTQWTELMHFIHMIIEFVSHSSFEDNSSIWISETCNYENHKRLHFQAGTISQANKSA
jgi:hypothetical protein